MSFGLLKHLPSGIRRTMLVGDNRARISYFRLDQNEVANFAPEMLRELRAEEVLREFSFYSRENDRFDKALKSFQRFYGLQPSGVIDDETDAAMRMGRCGNLKIDIGAKMFGLASGVDDVDELVDEPLPMRKLTFRIAGGTSDVSDGTDLKAVADAFAKWQSLSQLTFTEVGKSGFLALLAKADIEISWFSSDPDLSLAGNAIAHSALPSSKRSPVPVHFDEQEDWSSGHYNILAVALHEIGHVIGLKDSLDPQSVMFHSFKEGDTSVRKFSSADMAAFARLYP